IEHPFIADRFDRTPVCAAKRHQPACTSVVLADERAARAVLSFRIVEPGFPAGAAELSIADRAAHRHAPAGDAVVGALCDFCTAVRGRCLVRTNRRSSTLYRA